MSRTLDCCTEQHREEARTELTAELREFSHDGLVQLRNDLAEGTVLHGSWMGCVISYRNGTAGSVRRDRRGRVRNAFTIQWDAGWLTDEEVQTAVEQELEARRRRFPDRPGPRTVVDVHTEP